jgi:hypothetical protein
MTRNCAHYLTCSTRTAGLFSTSGDLSKFNRAILRNTLLGPAETRTWLKPTIFTSSLYNAVGAPWEIYRPTFLTSKPRPIDHYTKEGDVPQNGYSAIIVIIPEYNLGVSILTAGDDSYDANLALFDTVQGYLIPLVEAAAREQAKAKYAGQYISSESSSQSSLELIVDDGPGLKISEWTNNGKDMLSLYDDILLGGSGANVDARIYLVGEVERWRVTFEKEHNAGEVTVLSTACRTWEAVDHIRYGGLPCDEIDFGNNDHGINNLTIPGLRATLVKV